LPHILASQASRNHSAREDLEAAAKNLIEETLCEVTELLIGRASDIALLADYAAQNLQASSKASIIAQCLGMEELPEVRHEQVPLWLGLAELFLTAKDQWRKTINIKAGFPTKKDSVSPAIADARKEAWTELCQWCQQQAGLLEVLQDIRHLPAACFGQEQWQVLDALTTVLPQLSARLNLIFRSENVSDYTEITLAALNALGDEDNPTDLTLRLDNQINHILVDEFQDTSSVHFDMLRRLTAGWQADDGRTLFFVGDCMQSLYGFRNANVGLFMDVRQHPLGTIVLEPLDLDVNFRSQQNIIQWVNRLFSGAFPAVVNKGRGAVPYAHSQPFKAAIEGPAVNLDIFEDDPERLLQAEQVAQKVLAARVQNPSCSIAILVRGRAHLNEILPALREHHLPWQAMDIDPLANCMPVVDLLSLTRAMLNPADRIAWLAILRAPWCGLGLDDLLYLTNARLPDNPVPAGEHYPLLLLQVIYFHQLDSLHPDLLSEDGKRILTRIAPVLARAWQQRFRKPLRVWLEGLWIALGGPAALAEQQSLGQCRQYWDLLESHARDAGTLTDWSSFESAVANLYAEPAPSTTPCRGHTKGNPIERAIEQAIETGADRSTKETSPPIQIMTIHKAKGLEFDTVILPGLDRGTRSADAEILLWRERVAASGHTELLLSPPQKLGGDKDKNYEHLKREESLKGRLENTRVLYVACTRAIKHLHLLFHQPKKEAVGSSLLATLWPTLKDEIETPGQECQITYHAGQPDPNPQNQDANPGFLPAESGEVCQFQWRLPTDWSGPSYQVHTAPDSDNSSAAYTYADPADESSSDSMDFSSTSYFDSDTVNPQSNKDDLNISDDNARKTGILFHRTLQCLVADGLEQWHDERIARQTQVWQRQVCDQGITDPERAIETMMTALRNCLNDTKNAWIFDHTLKDSTCELAIGYLDQESKARTAVIDRTFIINNERWIIDYKLADHKLSSANANSSLDDFLSQKNQQYTPQLRHYARLFACMGNEPIKTALYFPLLSHLEVISI
ncbi:MAG: hypothetical protein DRR42_13430, partial [Gammaproteobacteria bacterium]